MSRPSSDGRFDWAVANSDYGAYELKITGTITGGSDDEYVKVHVNVPYETANLLFSLNANFVDLLGGTEDLGFWLSSLGTSLREVGGALGQLTLGSSQNLKTTISLIKARMSGDTDTITEITQRMKQDLQQQHELDLQKQQQKKKNIFRKK